MIAESAGFVKKMALDDVKAIEDSVRSARALVLVSAVSLGIVALSQFVVVVDSNALRALFLAVLVCQVFQLGWAYRYLKNRVETLSAAQRWAHTRNIELARTFIRS